MKRWKAALVLVGVLAGGASGANAQRERSKSKDVAAELRVQWLDVAVRDGIAFYARSDGMAILDHRERDRPQDVGKLGLRATVHGIALDGPRAWLAAGTHGLILADIEDPENPQVLARYETPGSARVVRVAGETVYLADHRNGAVILDVSLPERPRRLATLATRGRTLSLATDGRRLVTAEDSAGVRVFDVHKPAAPRERVSLRDIEDAQDVALSGDLLLVAAGRSGLRVYRLEGVNRALPLGTLDPGVGRTQGVWVQDGTVIVGYGDRGFGVVDLSDPARPRTASTLRLPQGYPVGRIDVEGTTAFVAANAAGFAIVDLADATEPRVVLPRRRRMQIHLP